MVRALALIAALTLSQFASAIPDINGNYECGSTSKRTKVTFKTEDEKLKIVGGFAAADPGLAEGLPCLNGLQPSESVGVKVYMSCDEDTIGTKQALIAEESDDTSFTAFQIKRESSARLQVSYQNVGTLDGKTLDSKMTFYCDRVAL